MRKRADSRTGVTTTSSGLLGTIVSGYRIEGLLGKGGMSVVYAARDERTGVSVAIKVLRVSMLEDESVVERFRREARISRAFSAQGHHENVCAAFEDGTAPDGRPFIVMERLVGRTLDVILDRGPMPTSEAADIVCQGLAGLAALHERRLLHRDLKPANVFVTKAGVTKLIDFGIAKSIASVHATRQGVVMGTAFYMSPEQAAGRRDLDERSDLYSMGAILYHCLAGHPPVSATDPAGALRAVAAHDVVPIAQAAAQLPAQLAEVVDVALAHDRAARFRSAREFARAVRPFRPNWFWRWLRRRT